MSRVFWSVVGVLLLAWVAWDLYAGYTLAWDVIYRNASPAAYWVVVAIWTVLGISCFFPWSRDKQ